MIGEGAGRDVGAAVAPEVDSNDPVGRLERRELRVPHSGVGDAGVNEENGGAADGAGRLHPEGRAGNGQERDDGGR